MNSNDLTKNHADFIRVVQFTDIHLLEDTDGRILNISPENSFNEVISHMKSSNDNPDFIILSGDLSEDGSHNSYQRLQKTFTELDIPVLALPGNHDSVDQMGRSLINHTINMDFSSDLQDWLIICLNSQIKGQDQGYVNDKDLSRLKMVLEDNSDKNCLIALHHSPVSDCQATGCQLENSPEFLALIEKYDMVKVVISGHTHWERENTLNHIKLLTTPSCFLHVSHPQEGESDTPDDIMRSHNFDPNKRGYRIVDLYPDGYIKSNIKWVPV